ncbi:MAG: hypothetical protein PHF56_11510 [Desulfuromonadaceae bacterium]|nr:hypothetical protein [Desulfuromonadaceae bacterium]
MSSLSQRIAGFIANLPHFQHDKLDGQFVAVRLTDGSIFVPVPESEDGDNGLLTVYWQGDPARKTSVVGASFASVEIVEACRYWVATGIHKELQEAVQFMFEHYKFKTGQNLKRESEYELVPESMQRLVKYLGPEIFKKFLGL